MVVEGGVLLTVSRCRIVAARRRNTMGGKILLNLILKYSADLLNKQSFCCTINTDKTKFSIVTSVSNHADSYNAVYYLFYIWQLHGLGYASNSYCLVIKGFDLDPF